jgi:hypothetical protein
VKRVDGKEREDAGVYGRLFDSAGRGREMGQIRQIQIDGEGLLSQ